MDKLKAINTKELIPILKALLTDFRILGSIIASIMAIYMLGYDMFYKDYLTKELADKDTALKTHQETLQKQSEAASQFRSWQDQTTGLTVTLLQYSPSNPASVVAANEKSVIEDIAHGKVRNNPEAAQLPEPHNKREAISISKQTNVAIDLSAPASGSQQPTTPPPQEAAAGSGPPGRVAGMGGGVDTQALKAPLPLERYDYEIKLTGTYPAIADFINELVTHSKLIAVKSIKLETNTAHKDNRPDPQADPNAPIKIDLTMVVSLYINKGTDTEASAPIQQAPEEKPEPQSAPPSKPSGAKPENKPSKNEPEHPKKHG